jgi:predicted Ser/Thr protein kinase
MAETIREYSVVSLLGEGGMGRVYLADDPMLERRVAIKVLNPELVQDPAFVARFKQEAKVQSSLRHTNIVALHTFFQENGKYCMVMEYAEGETLKSLIKRVGALPADRAARIMTQILDAVGHAHSKEIIHRDIKPSNIMIGAGDTVKVMDFGIAKILGERGLTRTGTKVGTLYYMSPEQVVSPKNVDQRTDVYSLGIVLFEILTGKLPLDTDTDSDFELMQQIVDRPVPLVTTVVAGIPQNVANALQRATTKERNDRIPSCEVFRSTLLGGASSGFPCPVTPSSKQVGPTPPPAPPQFQQRLALGGWLTFFGIALSVFAFIGLAFSLMFTVTRLETLSGSWYRTDGVQAYLWMNFIVNAFVTIFSIRAGSAILNLRRDTIARMRQYAKVYLIAGIVQVFMLLIFDTSRIMDLARDTGVLMNLAGTLGWYFIITGYFKSSTRVLATFGENLQGSLFSAKPSDARAPSRTVRPAGPSGFNVSGMKAELTTSAKRSSLYYTAIVTILGILILGLTGFAALLLTFLLPLAVLAGSDFLIEGGIRFDQKRGLRLPTRDVAVGFMAGVWPFFLSMFLGQGGMTIPVGILYGGIALGIPITALRYLAVRDVGTLNERIGKRTVREILAGWGKGGAAVTALMFLIQFVYVKTSQGLEFRRNWIGVPELLMYCQFIGILGVIPVGVRLFQDGRKESCAWMAWTLGGVTVSAVVFLPVLFWNSGLLNFAWPYDPTMFMLAGAAVFDYAGMSARVMLGLWLLTVVLARRRDSHWPIFLLLTAATGALLNLMPAFLILERFDLVRFIDVNLILWPSSWEYSQALPISILLHLATVAFFGALAYRWHDQDKRP